MWLFQNGNVTPFLVEEEAYEGVKRIADKVAEDVETVCGVRPRVYTGSAAQEKRMVLMATTGHSMLLAALAEQGMVDVSKVEGRREVYGIRLLQGAGEKIPALAGVEELLVIYGSDKRGTIYGMFHLSELLDVSPLFFWGDAVPQK